MRNPGRRSRFPARVVRAVVLAGFLVLLLLAAAAVANQGGSKRPVARAVQAANGIGFSHAVVVDQQRPGFEPDVKVDGNGVVYTSIPFGFSTTQSFVWSSQDGGNSYQFVPGNIGPGKPATCVGGGDTDLYLDPADALYFSDLQGLTNISNSMSTDGGATLDDELRGRARTRPTTGCGSRAPAAPQGGNLHLYQDYDAVDGSARAAAATSSSRPCPTDGTHFQPVLNTNLATRLRRDARCTTASPTTRASPATRSSTRRPATCSSPTPRPRAQAARPACGSSEGKITRGHADHGDVDREPEPRRARCAPTTALREQYLRRLQRQPRGARRRELRDDRAGLGGLPVRDVHRRPARPPTAATRTSARSPRRSRSTSSTRSSPRRRRPVDAHLVGAAGDHRQRRQRRHQHVPVDHRRKRRPSRRRLVPHERDQRAGHVRERLRHVHALRRQQPVQGRVVGADGPEPQRPRRQLRPTTTANVSEALRQARARSAPTASAAQPAATEASATSSRSRSTSRARRSCPTCSTPRPTPPAARTPDPR